MHLWVIVIICVLTITALILIVYAISRYNYLDSCINYANIACYTDYDCPYSVKCSNPNDSNCWPGVTAIYNKFVGNCDFPIGGGLPQNCYCSWSNSGNTDAQDVCQNIT